MYYPIIDKLKTFVESTKTVDFSDDTDNTTTKLYLHTFKAKDDVISLFIMTNKTTFNSSELIFKIPAKYAPKSNLLIDFNFGTGVATLELNTSGEAHVYEITSSNARICGNATYIR